MSTPGWDAEPGPHYGDGMLSEDRRDKGSIEGRHAEQVLSSGAGCRAGGRSKVPAPGRNAKLGLAGRRVLYIE